MTNLPVWADLLLVLGLVLRLNRLILTDAITDGLRWRVWRSAVRRDPSQVYAYPDVPATGWRGWVMTGLVCPFCVGFWVGVLVLASLAAVGGPGDAAEWWRWVALAFTLNWIAGHLGSRAGDAGYDEN